MEFRDIRQQQFADMWLERGKFGILNLAPRFGKIRVAINIMEKIKPSSVLIAYPDLKIKKSWEDDFKKWNYIPSKIAFTTFLSLNKHENNKFDLVIIDEIHLLSEAQIETCKVIFLGNNHILGLTGTLSSWSQKVLRDELNLPVVARYSIEMAIREKILPDYEINIVKVPLDNITLQQFGKKKLTEKKRFDQLMWVANREKQENGEVPFFINLKIIDLLRKSISRNDMTKKLIARFNNERLLIFCGLTDIADNLGIPSYHSKSEDEELWQRFLKGEEKHMAVVKIGNSGVTYMPLNKVIINHYDSNCENMTQRVNRCMSMEYDNPEKKAVIYIIAIDEKKELDWLNKALSMFDKHKIHFIEL